MDYTGDDYLKIFIEVFKGIIFAFIVGFIFLFIAILVTNYYGLTDIDFSDLFDLAGM